MVKGGVCARKPPSRIYRFSSQYSVAIMDSQISLPTCIDEVIEALVHACCGEAASAHEKYVYRESLRNLVRLAMAEQRHGLEIDFSVAPRLASMLH
jgi:hypothetical protein